MRGIRDTETRGIDRRKRKGGALAEEEDAREEEVEEDTGNRTTENKETSSRIGEMITTNRYVYVCVLTYVTATTQQQL